jgi:hypothetical protein
MIDCYTQLHYTYKSLPGKIGKSNTTWKQSNTRLQLFAKKSRITKSGDLRFILYVCHTAEFYVLFVSDQRHSSQIKNH